MLTVSTSVMRQMEANAIANNTSGFTLMKRAGIQAAQIINNQAARLNFTRAIFLVGSGNNGGDALVAAAHLNIPHIIYLYKDSDNFQNEALEAFNTYKQQLNISKEHFHKADLQDGDVIIDGLLGIGFNGINLKAPLAKITQEVNASNRPVIALDLPTGLNADTGIAVTDTIKAYLTITFSSPKIGSFLNDGPQYCGRLRVVDIGIDYNSIKNDNALDIFTTIDAKKHFPKTPFAAHKKSRGQVLIIAGSKQYPGAATLSATAALYSSFAGMVYLARPDVCQSNNNVPSAIVTLNLETNQETGTLGENFIEQIKDLNFDAVACGPGLGKITPKTLKNLLELKFFSVIDADGLNAIANSPFLWKKRSNVVLTPHHGEITRLAKAFNIPTSLDRITLAKELAKTLGCTILYKGPQTVIANENGQCIINSTGTNALATAGSGDVLTGLIAAIGSTGLEPIYAASLGAFIHGAAGELGDLGISADELPKLARKIAQNLIYSVTF